MEYCVAIYFAKVDLNVHKQDRQEESGQFLTFMLSGFLIFIPKNNYIHKIT